MGLINYLLEVVILSGILFGIYKLGIRKDTLFAYRRYLLLAIIFISIAAPLFHVSFPQPQSGMESVDSAVNPPTSYLPTLPVINQSMQGDASSTSTSNWDVWISVFIGLIAALLLLRMTMQIIRLMLFIRRNKNGSCVIQTKGELPTFAFLHYILINEKDIENNVAYKQILAHEVAHILDGHTYERLFHTLLCNVFWFNPFFWLISRETDEIHEFIADQKAMAYTTTDRYEMLLANQVLRRYDLLFASHFNKSITLKRMKMLKITTKNPSFLRSVSTSLLIILTAVFFACETDSALTDMLADENNLTSQEQLNSSDPVLLELMEKYPKINELNVTKVSTVFLNSNREEISEYFRELNAQNAVLHLSMDQLEGENEEDQKLKITAYISNDDEAFDIVAEISKARAAKAKENATFRGEEVFQIVENPAKYPGGIEAFYDYVSNNLNYPQQAVEKGIEGRVYVEFIVAKDGTINNVTAVRGIGAGCDEEAVRVVKSSPNWSPPMQRGRAVNQRMIIPITFKL